MSVRKQKLIDWIINKGWFFLLMECIAVGGIFLVCIEILERDFYLSIFAPCFFIFALLKMLSTIFDYRKENPKPRERKGVEII